MKIKREPVDERSVEAIADAIEELIEEPASFEVEHDPEAGTVAFSLVSGIRMVLRSPKPKQLLLAQSWYQVADADYHGPIMLNLKLAQLCCIGWGKRPSVTLDELLDALDEERHEEDIERIARALACFRSVFERLERKAAARGAGAAV